MPTYIGENKIVDRYLGDKFLEAVYIGDKKVYDPYTEITGNLPIIFKSRAAVALKNYRIYGTAEGAGVETVNLWGNFIITNKFITASGNELVSANRLFETLQFDTQPNRSYNMSWETTVEGADNTYPYIRLSFYNDTEFISRTLFDCSAATNNIVMFDTPNDCNKVDIRIDSGQSSQGQHITYTMLSEGIVPPDHYIPPGYKLPLTVESGAQSQDIPIYIGDSKLGEEEYVDFGGQKIYKVKPNLIIDTINLAFVDPSGVIVSNSQLDSAITPIQKGRVYTIKYTKNASSMFCGYFENYPVMGATTYNNTRFRFTSDYYTVTAPLDGYLVTSVSFGKDPAVFEGELPYLQPTDPPVPLPPIPTYKGENTLDAEMAPNAFDYSSLVMGSINVPGGEEVTSNTHKRTPYIEVDAGSVYILRNILSGGGIRIHQYTSDSSAGWTRSDLFNEGSTISLDATTKYVRMVATVDTYQSDTYFGLGKYGVGTVVINGRINEIN